MTNGMKFLLSRRIFGLLILALSLQACQQNSGGGSASASPNGEMCSAALDQASYFEDAETSADISTTLDHGSLRQRTVRVNIDALKADIKAGFSSLRLDLFNDKSLQVIVERIQEFSSGNYVVTGRLTNDPLSSVSLAVQSNVLVADINPNGAFRYNVSYQGNGTHSIQEMTSLDVDADDGSCLATPAPEAMAQDLMDEAADDGSDPVNDALAATPVIDMLVAYTPSAKSAAGGEAGIIAKIQSAVATTNKSFIDSGVNLQVRLVGTMAVKQNETGNWSSDLSNLSGKTDGLWDEVHAERARLGADQVSMVAVYSGSSVAGIGYIKASSSSAFTITKISAFGNFSFTHELGHNVGLNHSDGYVNTSGSFRTIMAYGTVTRIARFSNPSLAYKNYATGTSSQNSSKILNANGATTAGLLAVKVTGSTPDIPVIPGTGACP